MPLDLLSAVQNLFTGDVISQAADRLDESEARIETAVTAVIPAVLTGLLHKAGPRGDSTGALRLVRKAAGANITGTLISTLQNYANGWVSKGTALLLELFDNRVSQVINAVAVFAGIKASAASTLLHAATPAILGAAGEQAVARNLSGSGFLAYLNSQKGPILAAIPRGFNIDSLGLGTPADISSKLSNMAAGFASPAAPPVQQRRTVTRRAGNTRWLWPLLLMLAAIMLLWYLVKGCGDDKAANAAADTTAAKSITDTAVAQVSTSEEVYRERIKVILPDSTMLEAYKGGIEDQLVSFLNSSRQPAGKEVWFGFDDLHFAPGNANITAESRPQLQHIAAILKAYPDVKIKIGGYTDHSGDSLYNMRLSRSRAQAVYNELQKLQVNPQQIVMAAGYGDQFAKAPATAPEEQRRHDRQVAISVTEK
jgi:outer membrane protein OmpA-like peptidoglycan-associated protein